MPLYSLADRSAMAALRHREPQLPATPWINYLRVPAALSGLLLLVWFPLILRLRSPYHASATLSADPYLWHWLAVTGTLFLLSAVAFALRLRSRSRAVRSRRAAGRGHGRGHGRGRPEDRQDRETERPGRPGEDLKTAKPQRVARELPRGQDGGSRGRSAPNRPAREPRAGGRSQHAKHGPADKAGRASTRTGDDDGNSTSNPSLPGKAAPDRPGSSATAGRRTFVNAQIQVVLIAAGCTSAVGLIGMGIIWLLRRASLRLLLQVSGAVIVLAVVAGTLGTARAMFLSPHDLSVVVMVCVVAAVVAAGFGCLLGRQLQASSLALRQAARSLGDQDGGYRWSNRKALQIRL